MTRNSIRTRHSKPGQAGKPDLRSRRGLAMLELVLYLPIMLFVMALMINFGNIAAWKIRAQGNTRYAGWRTLADRTGQFDPHPPNWPQSASLSSSGGPVVGDVQALWSRQPFPNTPPVRGPVIAGNQGGDRIVVPGRFDMDAGMHAGDGRISRNLPMLRGILPNNGRFGFTQHQELLNGRWEYRHLNWPRNPYGEPVAGDGGNVQRRAKRWWQIDPPFYSQLQGELQQLAQADGVIKGFPARFDLDPLDRDNEFYWYEKRQTLGSLAPPPPIVPEDYDIRPPDFYLQVAYDPTPIPNRGNCTIDKTAVESDVRRTVDRIQRFPGSLGRQFAAMYQREISRLQGAVASINQQIAQLQMLDPPPQAQIAQLQQSLSEHSAEINRLQPLLDQVNRFVSSLPPQYR